MAISTTDLHRFTVEQFEQMSEFGVLPERGVELVDGLVVALSARGNRHGYAVSVLTELFVDQRAGRYAVNPENLTLQLGPRDAREPDLVLARRTRSYAHERPRPEDIALIVEVSDSSLAYDLGQKKIAYARSGIPEYWVVDIPHHRVHVFRDANRFGEAYLHESLHGADETIAPAEFPDAVVPVARILGLDA
jgi:Uma2 family endonuclease